MNDYTELDAAIVEKIKAGFGGSFAALSSVLAEKAKAFLPEENHRGTPAWRVIDRRLQALRKKGTIWYSPADRRWYCGPAP